MWKRLFRFVDGMGIIFFSLSLCIVSACIAPIQCVPSFVYVALTFAGWLVFGVKVGWEVSRKICTGKSR